MILVKLEVVLGKLDANLGELKATLVIMSLLLLVSVNGQAHETSFSYLEMHYAVATENGFEINNAPEKVGLQPAFTASWHIPLPDLQQMVDMDIDKDQQVLGWELRERLPLIQEFLTRALLLPAEADCQWSLSDLNISSSAQKAEVKIDMTAACGQGVDAMHLTVPQDFSTPLLYQLHVKPQPELAFHKGVLDPGQHSQILMLEADLFQSDQLQSRSEHTTSVSFFYFVLEGVKHILIGADHLVFLILLLFSAVWRKGDLVEFNISVLQKLFAYTGCFTIAHSITLALGWWQLTPIPMKWIEVLIALTIVWSSVAVIKQYKPLALKIVFIFGLIHGFGFASVLLESPAADYYSTSTLLGFNIGVELGQFLFLCVTAMLMRALSIKQTDYFARTGAFSALAVAGIWVFERSTGLMLIS